MDIESGCSASICLTASRSPPSQRDARVAPRAETLVEICFISSKVFSAISPIPWCTHTANIR